MDALWKDIASDSEDVFGAATIKRGWEYFQSDRVTLEDVAETTALAVVRGSRTYEVTVEIDPDEKQASSWCSCPAARRGPCKHVFATLLALEEHAACAARPSWHRQLDHLAPAEPRDPWTAVPGAFAQPVFVLCRRASGAERALVVRVMRRTPLKSGGWSAPVALVQGRDVVRFDASGRELYERVCACARNAVGYGYSYAGEHLSLDGPDVRDTLVEVARAGLLHIGEMRRKPERTPLRLDVEPPYAVRVHLDRGETVRLWAEFVRGEETLPIEEPDILLACGLMVVGDALCAVDYGGGWNLAASLRQSGAIEVPPEGYADLLARALEHKGPLPVEPAAPGARAVRPILRVDDAPELDPFDPYGSRHLAGDVAFEYGRAVVPAESPADYVVDPETAEPVPRDFEQETRLLGRLLELGGRPGSGRGSTARLPRQDGASVIARLLRDGWRVEGDGHAWRESSGFSLRVTSGIDWFDLEGGLDFDGQTVGLPEILRALREGLSVVTLPDGARGVLPAGLEERLELVGDLARDADGQLRFGKAQGWLLDALLAERDTKVEADAAFRRLRKRIAQFERIRPREAGAGFRGELRPYQEDALGWLRCLESMGLGGCLADDMGLGKTVMVLAHLLHHRRATKKAERKPALVVAPKSVVWNWIDEARRFAPSLSVLDYTGPAAARDPARIPEHDLAVTTYGVLRRDAAKLKDVPLSYAILDEAQAVKNPASQAWKAARLLAADHRLALTGTPVENHLGDLWAILEFLNPGTLGPRSTHAAWAKSGAEDGTLRARVARLVRPVVLRRTKEQVLKDLPPRQETVLHCEMGPTQRKAYNELRDYYRAALLDRIDEEGIAKSKMHVLEALLRLRQCACHPGLLDGRRGQQPSAKFEALQPLLEEVSEAGKKALVFSQFTSLLAILRDRLDGAGIPYAYLDGKTRRRDDVVRGFVEAKDVPLFLISLKAGGVGLNLTAADHVFLLDPWWNPAVERQAVDRTHRIGQTRKVNVYRLVTTDTIEERILDLQAQKRDLAEAVVGTNANLLRSLTRDDLAALLGS